jgi:hypothetical protein
MMVTLMPTSSQPKIYGNDLIERVSNATHESFDIEEEDNTHISTQSKT